MFVAIVRFPDVPAEREDEFQQWFAWSNDELREADGLAGRRLLRAADGSYTAVVEHASAETFAAMHTTGVASHVQSRLGRILDEVPRAVTYEIVADLATPAGCCGGGGGRGGHHGAAAGGMVDAQVGGSCCRDD